MKKRALLLILCILIVINISACAKNTISLGTKPDLIGVEAAASVDSFQIYTVMRNEIPEDYIDSAIEEFKKLFNIELSYTATVSIDISGLKSAQQVQSSGSDGLYLFPNASISRITELAETGDILPINKYLEENPVWNELPAAMRKMYEMSDGNIWALPRGFNTVVNGRVFRADYLAELELETPTNLESLYEVSKILASSDPDGNGLNDTYGMVYSNAGSFRDIFYANGVPVNTSNDGYQRTSISYNKIYDSFEDSMLMKNMKATLEYIVRLDSDGILRRLSGRYSSGLTNPEGNDSIANTYIRIPGYAYTDEKYTVVSGISGTETTYLNPLTYDFYDGFYLMGANTENPSSTINTFVSLMFGDPEGYLFASHGTQGSTYNYKMGTVEVLNKDFFSYNQAALVKSNPLYSYETMSIEFNKEFAGTGLLGDLIARNNARELFVETASEREIMYDITMELAYPEVFKTTPGLIINSSAGAMFDSIFSRVLSGRIDIQDAIDRYNRDMKSLGMQEIIDDLNNKIGVVTNYHY